MTKELLAIAALAFTLLSAAVAGAIRIGSLIERVDAQSKVIEAQTAKLDDLQRDLTGTRLEIMRWIGAQETNR